MTRNDYTAEQFALNFPPGATGALPARPRLLEVGSGPGIVLKALLAHGFDAWGSELGSPRPVDGIDDSLFTGVRADTLDAPFRSSVKGLLLFDVIEHIERDADFLRSLIAAFPRCLYVATVPARPEVWSNYDIYYRRYAPAVLKTTLIESGFQPSRMRYFFRSLYLAALFINTIARPSPLLRRAMAAFLAVENALLGPTRFIPGLSLFASGRPTKNGRTN
jgi:hypothetical protein